MIEVRAPGRLHFGLLNPGSGGGWKNLEGQELPARRFGGVGLMVDEPALIVQAEPSRSWSASGPLSERALEFARRFADSEPNLGPHAIFVVQAPPRHCGLGTGTQLGLAVGKVLAIADGHPNLAAVDLAKRVGRGLRSAVGVHGFQRGGLIIEGGKHGIETIAPLLIQEALPDLWRVVVMLPKVGPGLHGGAERMIFNRLEEVPALTETLCRLVLQGMLPALKEGDCRAFGEAVYDFNVRVGELFAEAQGGRYADPFCAELVTMLRGLGIAGVGQSSWGPTLFAIVEDPQRAADVGERVRRRYGENVQVWVTRPSQGAVVTM